MAGAASDARPGHVPAGAAVGVLAVLLLASLPGLPPEVTAQPDPEGRANLEVGVEMPAQGNGPLSPYAFFLWSRPHFPAPDLYARLVVAPTYLESELVRDRILGWSGHAVGLGITGGLFPYGFDDFQRGQYLGRRSFTGSGGEARLSYYPHVELGGGLPLEGQLRLAVGYVGYDKGTDTADGFQLPRETPVYRGRVGIRLGGRPPELLPTLALGVSVWYESSYRQDAEPYGLPTARDALAHFTDRAWGRLDAVATIARTHTLSLTAAAGTSNRTDKLSTYRMGSALPFRSEFPLILHGYYSDEVFARRFWLVNAAYRFPLWPGEDRLQLQLSADWARVEFLPGRTLPRSDLRGLGVDLTTRLTPRLSLVLGFGYGVDAPRHHGFGGEELGAQVEYRF